jgi:hypothetical protein
MSKQLTYTIDSRTADPVGMQLRPTTVFAARTLEQSAEWSPTPVALDGEESNPCVGIALGCGLSLVIWGGLLAVFYLLR